MRPRLPSDDAPTTPLHRVRARVHIAALLPRTCRSCGRGAFRFAACSVYRDPDPGPGGESVRQMLSSCAAASLFFFFSPFSSPFPLLVVVVLRVCPPLFLPSALVSSPCPFQREESQGQSPSSGLTAVVAAVLSPSCSTYLI